MDNLSSVLGGLVQGFKDLGKSTADMIGGTATSNIVTSGLDALVNKKSLAQAIKDADQRKRDFRRWLYDTDSDKDAAAKGLGTALNGAQAALDLIPGVGQSAPVNALQGALGGLSDEFKFNGENYDLGKAGQRALASGATSVAVGNLGKDLAKIGKNSLSNAVMRGAAAGGLGGALGNASNAAIDGADASQIWEAAKSGAGLGALIGGGTAYARNGGNIGFSTKVVDEPEQDYFMSHRPTKSGITGSDIITQANEISLPTDAYEKMQNYTGFPEWIDETRQQLLRARNNPDAEMTIYRATPGDTINDGDWITLSKAYADNHNRAELNGQGKVLSQKVPAKDIQFAGDDLMEWGYFPQKQAAAAQTSGLTPEQEAYFKNSMARDENGNLKPLYHGSANGEFNVFSRDYGNPEGDWGKGFYLTDNESDVDRNYVDGGPDFDIKVDKRAEQIAGELDMPYEQAKKQAMDELYKGGYKINAYANMTNPATVGKTVLFDGSEYPTRNLSDYDNIDDYYQDLIYDLADNVVNDTGIDYSYADQIRALLGESTWDGGISVQDLKNKLNDLYIEDYDGNLMGNEVARSILENMGYDGIIDPTVADKFKNMGLAPGTTHYIAFEPNQIKKTDNLNPTTNEDIRYSRGKNTQTSKDLPEQGVKRIGSKDVAPVDEATLPDSLRMANDYIKKGYIADIEKATGKKYDKMTDSDFLDYALNLKAPNDRELFREIIQDMVDAGSTTYKKYADSAAANKYLEKILGTSFDDMDSKKLMLYLHNNKNALQNNTIKDVDAELSDRLGIGRSNTFMVDNKMPSADAIGVYNPVTTTMSIDTKLPKEKAVNTLAHERLHSFQTEGDFKRYDKRVTDAYEELSSDLAKHLKTPEETKERYQFDADYWGDEREQQSRMLQQYLENKGFTKSGLEPANAGEWGNEINPAFDKFFDKLRALSKKGVALPALTALFGGGALAASQQDNEEKEYK